MKISRYKLIIILILFLKSSFLSAQPPIGSKNNVRLNYRGFMLKDHRWEAGGSLGIANSMTDIAPGRANVQASMFDVYSRGLSPALSANTRYRFNRFYALRANLGAVMLRGDDQWSSDMEVVNRGKSFRNTLVEGSLVGELYMPRKIKRLKEEYRLNTMDWYLFTGLSTFYHSPVVMGPYIDEYDRNLLNAENVYNKVQLAIPLGAGVQWSLANKWVVGFDFNFRYTFFDYLDGFKRPYSTRNDFFFTSNFNLGYIIDSESFKTKGTTAPHVFRGNDANR